MRLKARHAGERESLPPLADDLPWRIEASSDEVIGKPFGGHENDSGADDVTIRRRISTSHRLQLPPFLGREMYNIRALSWH